MAGYNDEHENEYDLCARQAASPPMTDHAELIARLLMPIAVVPPSDLDLPHLKGWNTASMRADGELAKAQALANIEAIYDKH